MARIKFEQGFELEHEEGGEYVLRFRAPQVRISPDPTGGHLKQAKKGSSSCSTYYSGQGNKGRRRKG